MGDQYPPKTIRDGGPTPHTIMHGVSDGDGACNIPQDITSVEKHDGNYADVCAWFKFDMFENSTEEKLDNMVQAGMVARKKAKASEIKKLEGTRFPPCAG